MTKLMTSKEAAAYLGVGLTTLWRITIQGDLSYVQLPGRHKKFDKNDLDNLIEMYKYKNKILRLA